MNWFVHHELVDLSLNGKKIAGKKGFGVALTPHCFYQGH